MALLKAKAAYILETLILGGVHITPFDAIVLKALILSIPDAATIYNSRFYSDEAGIGLEGESSVGINIAYGDNKSQTKLEIAELGEKFSSNIKTVTFPPTGDIEFCIDAAKDYSLSALGLKMGGYSLGNLINLANYGTGYSLKANYSPLNGLNSIKFSLNSSSNSEISILQYSTLESYNYLIPKSIINKNIGKNSLLSTISDRLLLRNPSTAIKIGIDYFSNRINSLYDIYPDTLFSYNDHIIFQENKTRIKGFDLGLKIDLNAAFGIGAGLIFGLKGSYFDELHYPKRELIFAHKNLFALSEYNNISDSCNLFKFKDELSDLFQGTISLIKETLKELVNVTEYLVQAGSNFIVGGDQNSEFKLVGTLANTGKIIIRVLDPTTKMIQKGLFSDPKIITAYSSNRIINNSEVKGLNVDQYESTLYIVSQNVNVSVTNNIGNVIHVFSPVALSLRIDSAKMRELDFGEEEKKLAKMYFYNTDSLAWIELDGNISNNTDTVTTMITNSGSYALGIEINPAYDIFPPQIVDYSPRDNDSTNAYPRYWAKLIEGATEVGIDLSRTSIIIDGQEVTSTWNPADKIISFQQIDSLSPGMHNFKVIAVDYNGNTKEINSTFKVALKTSIETTELFSLDIKLYPNPATDYTRLSLLSLSPGKIQIDVFNQGGQKVANLYNNSGFNNELDITWHLSDNNGLRINNGIYFIRVKNNERIFIKKLIVN